MDHPIFDPPIPYSGPIFGGKFDPGKLVRIQGTIPGVAYRFDINLQCGPEILPPDDIVVQVSVRILDGYILLNSLENSVWGEELRRGTMPLKHAEKFEIIVVCDFSQYKVMVNGQHYCDFPQRIHYDRITHLAIHGDVSIIKISYESASESVIDVQSRNNMSVELNPSAPFSAPSVRHKTPVRASSPGLHDSYLGFDPPPQYESCNQVEFVSPPPNAPNPIGNPYTPCPTNTPYHMGGPGSGAPSGVLNIPPPAVGAPIPLNATINVPPPAPGAPVPLNAFTPPVTVLNVKPPATKSKICLGLVFGAIIAIGVTGIITGILVYFLVFIKHKRH